MQEVNRTSPSHDRNVRARFGERSTPAVLVAVTASVALALGACGSGPSTSSPTTTSSATTKASPSGAVIDAYSTMWADLAVAATTSDYQSTLLPQHATGAALTLLTEGLARDQLHGIVTKGITSHHPSVVSLTPAANPTHAVVHDCFDDSRWIEYTSDGKRAKNTAGGRHKTTATLVEVGGTWKVSQLTVQPSGSC
jgi:hypothetical protein